MKTSQKTLMGKYYSVCCAIILLSMVLVGSIFMVLANDYLREEKISLLEKNVTQAARLTMENYAAHEYRYVSSDTLQPVYAVLGNNDFDEYGPSVGRFAHPVIDGVRFLVAHKPADVLIGFNGCAGLAPGDPIPQVRMHGHTHVPKLVCDREARPADMLVNPGAVFRPRSDMGRTVGRMLVEDGRILGARIETLGGSPLVSMGEPF